MMKPLWLENIEPNTEFLEMRNKSDAKIDFSITLIKRRHFSSLSNDWSETKHKLQWQARG